MHYRQVYYGALDHVVEAIRDRFDQPGCSIYRNLEELVVKAFKGELYNAELDCICDFYKDDLSRAQLEAQLPLLQPLCDTEDISNINIHDVVRILGGLSSSERLAFSSVWTTMKLLLVIACGTCPFALLWLPHKCKLYHFISFYISTIVARIATRVNSQERTFYKLHFHVTCFFITFNNTKISRSMYVA